MKLPLNEKRPLIGIVSRFAGQKGFDLVAAIAPELAEMDLAMVVLGSGDPRSEQMFRTLAEAHPQKFAVRIGYDNGLAHRIEAGADMFLMPSQIRALRLEPDVQPALRHRPHRPRHRRARRHRR